MKRRAADYRRSVRRRLWFWIWSVLGLFTVAGLVLFVIHHNHDQDPVIKPSEEKNASFNFDKEKQKTLNFTEEMGSAISFSRQLTEQMTLAKAYIVIAKEHNNLYLAWRLSSNVRKCQLLLAKAAMQGEPIKLTEAEPIIKSLSSLIYKAQDEHYDIATTIVTLKSHIQALEARANAATVQSAVFGQMAAETLPKNVHCSILKLSLDWVQKTNFKGLADEVNNSPRLVDNNLYHFCLFSDNVVSTAVVVNSTVCNTEHPKQLVFHIVTDSVSYGAMQSWFLGNDFKGATIEVQNIEELSILHGSDPLKLTHLRFYIPEIYPQLEKVVFLDDDVVVQKELTSLFSLELHGNVNAAVETCLESFHRLYKYLNFSNPIISSKFDPQACAWAFGMNVFDLIAWRKSNVTARYHFWEQQNSDQSLWRLGTLPPALLAFYGLTEPLDKRWHVLGLGYDQSIDSRLIESAAVVHFNGYMKPWLKLGITRYKPIWERYVNTSHPYLRDCVAAR